MPSIDREYVRRLDDFTSALAAIVDLLKNDIKKDNVDTVNKMLSNMNDSIGEVVKNIEIVKESVSKIEDQNDKIIREISELKKQKEGGGLGSITEVDNKKKIIDAVQMIVLIAGGILAIGLAFKMIAPVNFLSVLAIGLALVFITGAFVAVSTVMKEIKPKEAATTMGLMILMAGAITVSSWLLAMASNLTLVKSLSVILITGALGVSLYLMSKAIKDSALKPSDYPKFLLMPLILPLLAAGLAFASYFLSMITPMSIMQALTTVFIAGALGLSLVLISEALGKTNLKEVGKFLLLPIILPAMALGIVLSSLAFQFLQPLSFNQMISAIFVAVTIGVVVFFMKPLIEKLDGVTLEQIINTTLLIAAISAGLVVSSWILTQMSFFSFKQAIGLVMTSIAIGLSILILTPAIKLLKGIETKEMWQATKNVVMASGAIAVSSILLSIGMYNNYPSLGWAVGAGLSIIAFAGSIWIINKMNVDNKKMLTLALTIVGIAGAIMLTSLILSLGNYRDYPSLGWAFGAGLSLVAFGGAMYILGQRANAQNFIKGGIMAIGIASAIVIISYILAAGNYKKYPTVEWAFGAGLALLAFGGSIYLLGQRANAQNFIKGGIMAIGIASVLVLISYILAAGNYKKYPTVEWTFGAGLALLVFGGGIYILGSIVKDPSALLIGALAALLIAGTIALASHILALGSYESYPTLEWSQGSGLSLFVFGGSMLLLGLVIIGTAGIGVLAILAGAFAMLMVADTIVRVSEILSNGNYSGGPSLDWATGTGILLTGVGLSSVIFAALYPFIWLGRKSMTMIAETIADVSHILQKGDYKSGPTLDWAKGVSMSIKAFAEGSAALSGGPIGGLINKIFGIDKTAVIESIAWAMVNASHILQNGIWSAYPSDAWSKGVGNSIMAFATAIKALDDADIDSGFEFFVVVRAISKGIIEAAKILNEFNWDDIKNYPSKEWSEAVGNAINAFAKPLSELAENDITGRDISKGIARLTQGMVGAALTLSILDWEKYNNSYPQKEWVDGVGEAIGMFVKYLTEIEKNDIGNGDLRILRKTVDAMIYSARKFKISEMLLSGLWEAGPTNDWSNRVGKSIGVFVNYLIEIEKNDIGSGDLKVLNKTIDSMLSTSKRFKIAELIFKDLWDAGPTNDWSNRVGNSIEAFVKHLTVIEKNDIGKGDLKILNKTIDSMINAAYRFKVAELIFNDIWKSGPSKYWASSVGEALAVFVKHLVMIEEYGVKGVDIKILNSTIDAIINTAFKFNSAEKDSGKELWKTGPSIEWSTSVGKAISNFATQLAFIGEADIKIWDIWKLERIVGAIIKTAQKYHDIETAQPGIWNTGPSLEWATGISKTISAFAQAMVIASDTKNLAGIDGLGDKMISLTIKLEKALSGKKMFGRDGLFEAFSQSIKSLSQSFSTNDKVISGMNQFATAFMKISSMGSSTSESIKMLTKSILMLSKALEDVDMESIDKLSKFSNGLLVLSLIDEDKFEQALEVIQSKKNDIISMLSDNNTVKSTKSDYGSTRVEMPKAETKETTDFYKQALGHLSGLNSNVGKMLEHINKPKPVKQDDDELSVATAPAKVSNDKKK